MLELTRDFDNVTNIQNLIRNCKKRELKLQHIINNLNSKKEVFTTLNRYHTDVKNAEHELESYQKSILFRYFRFFPSCRNTYNSINDRYTSCLDVFKNALNSVNISDVSKYPIHANNFNKHYAKLGMFEDLLKKETTTKNELHTTLKSLKVRVLDEYLAGLSSDLLDVVKKMPSEQVLILKNLLLSSNLKTIDYKTLNDLHRNCCQALDDLKADYDKVLFTSKSFSKATQIMILYKKAFLKGKPLSATAKKLVQKTKVFMKNNGIKSEAELNKKELECKKQLDAISQKIDELSIKKSQISSLLESFEKSTCVNKSLKREM